MSNRRTLLPGMMWYGLLFEIQEVDSVAGSIYRKQKIWIVGLDWGEDAEKGKEIIELALKLEKAKKRIDPEIALTNVTDSHGTCIYSYPG